ncbi:MAG: RNA polymerase sigma factor [Balneolaceae bacterium]|nr:RNA polymerase sigma factor [Balneolaceae bacterium]MBO6545681.1 RNA polymerase sigma factor [Balneolaceae bacterium]MBO6647077.1 RNA polymerase sigma factor [Balneolaceae bacterium]
MIDEKGDSSRESKLIEECSKAENRQAQEALYKEYYSYAMSIAIRYINNREEAVEITNDSFMKVFKSLHTFDRSKSFKSWFRRIIINLAIDRYRSKKANEERILLQDMSPVPDNYEEIISSLTVKDILSLLHRLPHNQRMVFNLYEIENYSHSEISDMLGITESSSRSCLTRAKARLRELFSKKFKV